MDLLRLTTAFIVLIIGYFVSRISQKVLKRHLKKRMPEGVANNTARLMYYALVFLSLMFAFITAGFDVSGLVVAGGVAGIAIGFASKTTVSNLISGLFLYISRPIYIGDPVEIKGVGGVVQDIGPFMTLIETWDGSVASIPNDSVFSSTIHNYRDAAKTKLKFNFKIAHSCDSGKAIGLVRELLKKEPFLLKKPESAVYLSKVDKDFYQISIRAWSSAGKGYPIKQELQKKIIGEMKKNKIKLV